MAVVKPAVGMSVSTSYKVPLKLIATPTPPTASKASESKFTSPRTKPLAAVSVIVLVTKLATVLSIKVSESPTIVGGLLELVFIVAVIVWVVPELPPFAEELRLSMPWNENSWGSKLPDPLPVPPPKVLDQVVSVPFILLNHLPSFSLNSTTEPSCWSVVIDSTYQPSLATLL